MRCPRLALASLVGIACVVLAVVIMAAVSPALVEAAPQRATPPRADTPGAPDATGLEAHLDQIIPARLAETGVPGVVVSVVRGDEVVLVKGWGLADVASATPMDGERTVVRVASISKTFTATAIAQLQSQGRLSVDAPVDDYLPAAQLPSRFEVPVTLRHLLSHTGGFINNNVGRVSTTPPSEDLAAFVTATMPPQIHAPGTVVLYSNHGNALAGWVVQEVAGTPFAEHIAREILQPLAMDDSSFERTPALASALATGYTLEDGEPQPYPYLYFKTIPASTLHTTAADMAHFMIMHLGQGRFDGRQVLDRAAAERMLHPVAAIHPALPTYHYAFAHGHTAGHRTRSHGGSVPAFLSRMVLFDAHGLGVFVCQNAFGEVLTGEIVDAVAAALLPPPPIELVRPVGDGRPEDPQALVGDYRPASKLDTPAFTRARALLLEAPTRVDVDDEGFLTVDGDRFLRTDALVFQRPREDRAPEVVAFVRDDAGTVRWVHRGLHTAVRPPWHGARWLHALWLGLAVVVMVGGAVGPRLLRRSSPAERQRLRLSGFAARLALVGVVVPHAWVAWVDAGQEAYLQPMRFGMPTWLSLVRVAVPLAAGLAWVAVLPRLRDRSQPRARRVAIAIAVGLTLVPLSELYWRTPGPGLLVP